MKEANFIQKDEQSPFHKDFKALQEEAIEGIQNLAGDLWTDYNTHDPGVTILENLVFAITDLCYKLGFDVQDYLVDEEGQLDHEHLGLYTPGQILTTNPVTIQDFRKVLFDQIDEIENVWVEPVPAGKGEVEGLYNMYVYLDPASWNQGRLHSEELKSKVEKDILGQWPGIRSFGEDLNKIVFLEPQYIFLRGELIFKNTDSLEETLAEIVYQMDNYFSPSVGRKTLEDLVEADERLEDIFDGPLLNTGFISNLPARPTEVSRARVLAILSNISDIERVERLRLIEGEYVDGKWEEKENTDDNINIDRIKVKEGFIPRFRFEKNVKGDLTDQPVVRSSGTDWIMTLKLRKKSSSKYLPVSYDKMIRSLRKMQALRNRSYSIKESKSQQNQHPVGQYRDFGRYFSVREVFPYIYGVNRFGLSRHEKELRKAQVKQLKGYLLLFEQLLANTTSQIQNLKNIYSTADEHASRFYYPKTFSEEEMEDIAVLYDLEKVATVDDAALDPNSTVLNLAFEGFKDGLSGEQATRSETELLTEFKESFFEDPVDFCDHFEKGMAASPYSTDDAYAHLDEFLKHTGIDSRVAQKAFEMLEANLTASSEKKAKGNLLAFNEGKETQQVNTEKVLQNLMDRLSQHLPHLPHKSKVLDYMLGLYGEQFRQKTLRRIGGPRKGTSEEQDIIENKLRMIRKLPNFSANLSKAPSYPASREPSEMNGFELKVQVLLGLIENDLDGSEGRSLFNIFNPRTFVSDFAIRKEPYYSIEQKSRIKSEQIYSLIEKRLIPSLSDFEEPADHSILTDEIKRRIKFFKHDYFSESFLKNGVDPEAYFIYPITKRKVREEQYEDQAKYYSHVWKEEGGVEESHSFHLLLRTRFYDRTEWFDLGTLDSLEHAVNMGWYLIDICGDLNRSTERFTLIDHIMLRPDTDEEDVDFREFFKDNQQVSITKEFNFYNFTASLILPKWNRRFGDRAFQQLADETILLNLPAHILGHVHWLDVERYQEYEKYYEAWISDLVSVENRRLESLDAKPDNRRMKERQLEEVKAKLQNSRKAFVLFLLKLQQDRFHETL
ncbi:MAG: hypothetical protein R8G66_20395 [Cytophagales bacterium]|nr:hypothetical protein [Cytophagales bacterium]